MSMICFQFLQFLTEITMKKLISKHRLQTKMRSLAEPTNASSHTNPRNFMGKQTAEDQQKS